MGVSRRTFLKLSGLTAAGSLVSGLATGIASATTVEYTAIPGVDSKALFIDVTRCIGCASCVTACKKQNNLPAPYKNSKFTNGDNWTAVKFYKKEDKDNGGLYKVKMQCMHCNEPSCVAVCPTGAAFKREDGIVLIDGDVCIACRNCVVACPYAIPGENKESGVVEKCTFCKERMAEGKPTACAEACSTGAVQFGEREELLIKANERLGQLKKQGYTNANIYGNKELGGLKVIYILPDHPLKMGFMENPKVATGDVLLKWAMGLVTAGAVIAGPLRKVFRDADNSVGITQDKGVQAGE